MPARRFLPLVLATALLACGVPRGRHAAALRELELAQARLADARHAAQQEQAAAKAERLSLQEQLRALDQAQADQQRAHQDALSSVQGALGAAEDARAEAQRDLSLLEGALWGAPAPAADPSAAPLVLSAHPLTAWPLDALPLSFSSLAPATLRPASEAALREAVASILKENPSLPAAHTVLIVAHASNTKDDLATASGMALAVSRVFLAAGWPASSLRVLGVGAAVPRCVTDTSPACVAANQRVGVHLLSKP